MRTSEDDLMAVASLPNMDGWKALEKAFVEVEQHMYAALARQLMAGNMPSKDEMDERRAYMRAMREILQNPASALNRLEKIVKS